jgi:hypothetical protein
MMQVSGICIEHIKNLAQHGYLILINQLIMFTYTLVGKPDLYSYRQTVIRHAMDVGGTRDMLNINYQKMHEAFIDYRYNN